MGRAGDASSLRPSRPRILETRVIELLVSQGVTVICAGGGGIPVVERSDGGLAGVEAVIDKDLASALVARQLRADKLILLTDVDAVYEDWALPSARAIRRAAPDVLEPTRFAPGSMGPKVEAAVRFARQTGKPAAIGRLEDAAAIVADELDMPKREIYARALVLAKKDA